MCAQPKCIVALIQVLFRSVMINLVFLTKYTKAPRRDIYTRDNNCSCSVLSCQALFKKNKTGSVRITEYFVAFA